MRVNSDGNYDVVLNDLVIAVVVRQSQDYEQYTGWRVMTRTSARQNGRNRYPTPQKAIQAYFGRKAIEVMGVAK